MKTRTFLPALLALTALNSSTQAQIDYYDVGKEVSFTQVSNAQPTESEVWIFYSAVYSSAEEVQSAAVGFDLPPPVSYEMYQALPSFHAYYSSYYATEAELDANYPSMTYTITVDRGAGPESADVFLPVGLYCPEIPYFTGDTYDRFQNYDALLPFDAYINGFTLAPGTTYGTVSFVVVEENVGSVFSVSLEPSDTYVEIPAGTLTPGTNYSIGITYMNSLEIPEAGFGVAISGATFHRGTTAYFTTLSDPVLCAPCDANCDGSLNLFDIQPFIDRLTGASGGCAPCTADTNSDGSVNLFDITPFVECLSG